MLRSSKMIRGTPSTPVSNIKTKIATEVANLVIANPPSHPLPPDSGGDEAVHQYVLKCVYRSRIASRSLALTEYGLDILKKQYRWWEIDLARPVNMQDLLTIWRESKLPYYEYDDKLITFDGMFAVTLRLIDGDLAKLKKISSKRN